MLEDEGTGQEHFLASIEIEGFLAETDGITSLSTLSWNHGVSNHAQYADKLNGKSDQMSASHQALSFTKFLDHHSPDLFFHCHAGTISPRVVLRRYWPDAVYAPGSYRGAERNEFRIELRDATLESSSISGAHGGMPTESWSFDYRTITWTYIRQDPDGTPRITHSRTAAWHDAS